MSGSRWQGGLVVVAERTPVAAGALAALVRQTVGGPATVVCDPQLLSLRAELVLQSAARSRAAVVLVGEAAMAEPASLLPALRRQGTALAVICDRHVPVRWLRAQGRAGCVLISSAAEPDEIGRALEAAASGKGFVSADLSMRLERAGPICRGKSRRDADGWQALSARERSVARLLSEGADRRVISAVLALSPKTVSTYRCRVMRKLRVDNDVQLARRWHLEVDSRPWGEAGAGHG